MLLGDPDTAGDFFGCAVAISDLELAVGTKGEDGIGEGSPDSGAAFTLTLSPNSFPEWAASQGLTGNDAIETAIPKNDGVPNLLAYALGLPVGSGGLDRLPKYVPNGCSFLRPVTPPSDITFVWQESGNLSAWDDLATLPSGGQWTGDFQENVSESIPEGGFTRVTVTHSRSAPKLFMRLKVIRN
jgi:hypothetical protein